MNRRLIGLLLGISVIVLGCGKTAVIVADAETPAETQNPSEPPGEPFQFANDSAGTLLAATLAPTDDRRLIGDMNRLPRPFPGPRNLEAPPLAIGPGFALMPDALPEPIVRTVRPRLVMDEAVFNTREELSLPQAIFFPVPDRVRLASVDVNVPPALPILAIPLPDRVSLDDPTGDLSAAASVSAALPQRTSPVPFVKLKVPEPFENRSAGRLALVPPELDVPTAAATLRTPGK